MLTLSDIETITRAEGEAWGYPHVRRVLRLINLISKGLSFDPAALQWAAWLHDWGAFPRYRQPGVDHALRSRQIAEMEILPQSDLSRAQQELALDAIARHDYRDPSPTATIEALLLREADWLDMLGAIGIARELAWGPNDFRVCLERAKERLVAIPPRLQLAPARQIAAQRTQEMRRWLDSLRDESFGYL